MATETVQTRTYFKRICQGMNQMKKTIEELLAQSSELVERASRTRGGNGAAPVTGGPVMRGISGSNDQKSPMRSGGGEKEDTMGNRRKSLLKAIFQRSLEELKEWEKNEASTEAKDVNFTVGVQKYTPLMLAVARGNLDVIKYLVENLNARKDAKDTKEQTAQDLAKTHNVPNADEIVKFLSGDKSSQPSDTKKPRTTE
mmetsp:Transcript_15663/g.52422  ORF Transcript_15663/g.52422 Transcript_15663/m.52422 type:complete len:199 (-) Transcript_15663:133-729(-)